MKSRSGKHPEIIRTFLVKLFSKSFEERRLFGKKAAPGTLLVFQSWRMLEKSKSCPAGFSPSRITVGVGMLYGGTGRL
ncbi:hypothetical protein CXP35_09135 [Komagataeibacter xylinus]|nr:hypothetical protein CXP35_09135 [Komagataeibacter xylinus]